MEGSLSTPCVTSSFWGCRHGRFIGSQSVLLVHLILGCVGWFFESVVGWVLDLGCQLKMVVVFEFYSPGWTSYAGCLQLVTMAVFSASYLWWFFLSHCEDRDSICIIWYQLSGWHSESCCQFVSLQAWFFDLLNPNWWSNSNRERVGLVESFELRFPLFRCYQLFGWVYIIWSWVKILIPVCNYL
jgi:hypothetical protein